MAFCFLELAPTDHIEDGTLDNVDQRITSDLQVVLDGQRLWGPPTFPYREESCEETSECLL